eukprot:1446571-Pleurochrysis_carterae.AAC.1
MVDLARRKVTVNLRRRQDGWCGSWCSCGRRTGTQRALARGLRGSGLRIRNRREHKRRSNRRWRFECASRVKPVEDGFGMVIGIHDNATLRREAVTLFHERCVERIAGGKPGE